MNPRTMRNDAADRRRPHAAVMMIRAAVLAMVASVAPGLGISGCGNYSNDDLEFLNALPARENVTVEVPARSAALLGGAAEGWRTAWTVSRTFNATAEGLLALVDKIRSSYPTSRNGEARVWGPFPSDRQPAWKVVFSMMKNVALDRFEYVLEMIPPPGVTLALGRDRTVVLSGRFMAAARAGDGVGHLELSPGEARQAGVVFENLDRLQTLALDYDYRGGPRVVNIVLTYDPPRDPAVDVSHASYHYRQDEQRENFMQFELEKDVVPGPAGVDSVHIQSQWRADGRGREDREITAGDGVGAMTQECWNDTFQSTYQSSWSGGITGDPTSCVAASP